LGFVRVFQKRHALADARTEAAVKITMEQRKATYCIEQEGDDWNIEDVRDEFLIPLLVAAGYHPQSVHDLFFEDEGED
jgi:hypothetical protein